MKKNNRKKLIEGIGLLGSTTSLALNNYKY